MSYVYVQSEPGLHTVGFYRPDGKWVSESDHRSERAAAARVHYLNGGTSEADDDDHESRSGHALEARQRRGVEGAA